MRVIVEKMIDLMGVYATIIRNGAITKVKGIFMPTTSRSWQNMQNVFSELGEAPRGQYNYISAVEPGVQKGDLMDVGNKHYLVRRAEVIYDSKGPLYCWALCVERGGADTWNGLE